MTQRVVAAPVGDRRTEVEAANVAIATEFLEAARAGRVRDAWRRLGAAGFVHHNRWFRSDAESLLDALDADARANPGRTLDIQRTLAEGPLVAVHSRLSMGGDAADLATVHIFRIEDGRIRELWDLAQQTPADSPNELGQF